jgi:serine/threonine protein kinase
LNVQLDRIKQLAIELGDESTLSTLHAVEENVAIMIVENKKKEALIATLSAKVDKIAKETGIDPGKLKIALDQAVTARPDFTAHEQTFNGVTCIFILDRDNNPDILIKRPNPARGAVGEVYKAYSARTGETQVVKVASSGLQGSEALDREFTMGTHLNEGRENQGLQPAGYRYGNMLIGRFYDHGDLSKQIAITTFARDQLEITGEVTSEKIREKLVELRDRFEGEVRGAKNDEARGKAIQKFNEKVAVCFSVLLDLDTCMKLTANMQELSLNFDEKQLKGILAATDVLIAKIEGAYIPRSLKTKATQAAQLLPSLGQLETTATLHGDIKPANFFWSDSEAVLGDFDATAKISDYFDQMDRIADKWGISSEKEATELYQAVEAIKQKNEMKIGKITQETFNKLEKFGFPTEKIVVDGKEIVRFKSLTEEKKRELEAFQKDMNLRFPAKTDGYASEKYRTAMTEAFWRRDKEGFKRACHAFDMRAMGVSIFENLTSGKIPVRKEEDDPLYYGKMREQLQAVKPEKMDPKEMDAMCDLIVKMSRPALDAEGKAVMPLNLGELNELQKYLMNFAEKV